MKDDEVKKWLSAQEAWAYDASSRAIVKERAETSNPDGTPRVTYVSGPWHATVAALRTLAETRKAYALLCSREGLCPQDERERLDVTYVGAQFFEDFFSTMPRPPRA